MTNFYLFPRAFLKYMKNYCTIKIKFNIRYLSFELQLDMNSEAAFNSTHESFILKVY